MFRWVSDTEIAHSIGLRTKPSIEKTLEWIERSAADLQIQAYAIQWNDTHVGNVILDRADSWTFSKRLSIYIGEPTARGCGVGSTAVYRAAEIYFAIPSSNKIWLTVHAENRAAIESYKRVGFRIEGTLREEFNLGGRLVDTHHMGMLRGDFERVQA